MYSPTVLVLLIFSQQSLQESCSNQKGPCDKFPCCPIKNGKSFCNTNTHRCEASRFCEEENSNCPFNDLTADEIKSVMKIIRSSSKFSSDIQFSIVRTQEPPKKEWNAGSGYQQRLAYSAVFDSVSNILSEVVVDLGGAGSIVSIKALPSKLPAVTNREDRDAQAIFKQDLRVKIAYERRGLNFSYAETETWAMGSIGSQGHPTGKRLIKVLGVYREPWARYHDWHPVEGVQMTVDLNSKSVYEFLDEDPVPAPPKFEILKSDIGMTNSKIRPLKPLEIRQPKGTSIHVEGQHITWYKWKLRYSMDYIHGLQLFHVRYFGDCEERLVLYKATISEMFVPYGDTGKPWRWRSPFDIGEYGLGRLSNPLIVGVDLPENALTFNCTMVNDDGKEPVLKEACVGAYERDAGIMYKHSSDVSKNTDGKRARDLVLTFTSAVGNYDYVFEYIFKMDGGIDFNVKLTGIILPRGVTSAKNDATCIESCTNLVDEYLIAPTHQHFFNYRLDLDVDGASNYVMEVDVVRKSDTTDPADSEAFSVKKRILKKETSRNWNMKRSRSWHIVNAHSRNKFGSMRGYALKPSSTTTHGYLNKHGLLYPQAQFVRHQFWATVHEDEERCAAGTFPRSGTEGQGLPGYIRNEESLENTDVVIWYTVGVTHGTRPEEWPIMSTSEAGFHLRPFNFMSANQEIPLSTSQC